MWQTILKRLQREIVMRSVFFLPRARRVRIERWLRGREEHRKLRLADAVIVSFGKSGRTWLRVMMSRFYSVRHGLPARSLIGFDNFYRRRRQIPRLFFTHDNYLRDYTGHTDSKCDFYDRKVVLLVRDPRDVAVSQFFQWKHRMRPAKKRLNDYPDHQADVSVFDFVVGAEAGLPKVLDYMNDWGRELERIGEVLIVRYEDLRTDPAAELERILVFIGEQPRAEEIAEAVEFASFENMKAMESQRVFWLSGSRLTPKDRNDPNSYKVRRAKVGGYRDYFSDEEVAKIDALIARDLLPVFGYTSDDGGGRLAVGQ